MSRRDTKKQMSGSKKYVYGILTMYLKEAKNKESF